MRAGAHVRGLITRLKQDGLDDLVPSLAHTRDAVEQWWAVPRLTAYTDHTHFHSARVAKRAHQLATIRALPAGVELNPLESYLLEMASWVHDIGMQAVADASVVKSRFPNDPNIVRKNHAKESLNFLMSTEPHPYGFSLGLPTNHDSVVEFIAWLAYAHGTESYIESIGQLREVPRLNEREVRGPLLAALLLMADELDLHAERARSCGGVEEFGEVSNAHWLKHECVDDVAVDVLDSGGGEQVKFSIRLKSFSNMSSVQYEAVRCWIRDKIQVQLAMIEPEITSGFKNYYHFDREIDLPRSPLGARTNGRVRDSVIAVMAADNARSNLINHETCHQTASEAIANGQSVVVIGEDVGVQEDGREDIFNLLCAELRAGGSPVWVVGRDPDITPALSASDLLAMWLADAESSVEVPIREHENEKRERLLPHLRAAIAARDRVVLAISSIDLLASDELAWLLEAAARELPAVNWLLTSTHPLSFSKEQSDDWAQVQVGSTPSDAIKTRLKRFMSETNAERMVAAGAGYATARRYGLFGEGHG